MIVFIKNSNKDGNGSYSSSMNESMTKSIVHDYNNKREKYMKAILQIPFKNKSLGLIKDAKFTPSFLNPKGSKQKNLLKKNKFKSRQSSMSRIPRKFKNSFKFKTKSCKMNMKVRAMSSQNQISSRIENSPKKS
mmetsp:Transcript_13218/g.11698  ORF Transcript_13218/g.11698 Transcript_13218/m.11698 type:complete len:134 (-) Transcript_13218:683-1084(-)